MKQSKLVREIYQACLQRDMEKLADLRMAEYAKIFKRKAEGKPFGVKWTLVKL